MRLDRFKKIEQAVEAVFKDNCIHAYGVTVHAFQVKYCVSRDGFYSETYRHEQELRLNQCVEALRKKFGTDGGLTVCMSPGDSFTSPYLIVYEMETGVWP